MGLRVGLTGGLGSGKSTVAAMLAARGATVFSADELARGLMQLGQAVYAAIVQRFGPEVVLADGTLDRPALARIAFAGGRVEELNSIIHPATIGLQTTLAAEVFARRPDSIVVVESALIFESRYAGEPGTEWHNRFDRLILVTAPEEVKVARFIARSAATNSAERESLAAEALRRLSTLIPDDRKIPLCDYVILNNGSMAELEEQTDRVWRELSGQTPL